jgi:hypothetical protein
MNLKHLTLLFTAVLLFGTDPVKAQIPNSGFELWTRDADGNLNPAGWETTNDDADIAVLQYSPGKQGDFAMRVKVYDPIGFPMGGIATLTFPYNKRPDGFSGWLKASVMPGDAVYVILSLWKGDTIIAAPDSCTFVLDSTVAEYRHFSYKLAYQSSMIPDSASIMVVAGKSGNIRLGTEIILDDIEFTGTSGIEELSRPVTSLVGNVYPNPSPGTVFIPLTLISATEVRAEIFDLTGKRIRIKRYGILGSGSHELILPSESIPDGIYSYQLTGKDLHHTGKFTVRR